MKSARKKNWQNKKKIKNWLKTGNAKLARKKKLAKPKKNKKLAKNWQKVQNKLAAKSLKKVQNWPQKLWNTKLTINRKAKTKSREFPGPILFVVIQQVIVFFTHPKIICYFLKTYRKSAFSNVDFKPLIILHPKN